jgi:hypothetical protein
MRRRVAATILAGWSETHIIESMRAWRRGCSVLAPWFRATPFASAHHYRDRDLRVRTRGRPPSAIEQLALALPPAEASVLWILDFPGTVALWLGYILRQRRGLALAVGFNGWYDPEGCLDGRAEIPLLLGLGARLRNTRPRMEVGLMLDRDRLAAAPDAMRLDNRYHLGEEDFPPLEHLRRAGWRAVFVFTDGAVAPDLGVWLDDIRSGVTVEIVAGVEVRAA